MLLSSNNPLDSDHDRWDTRQEQIELTHNYHSLRYVTCSYSAEHIVDVIYPACVTGRLPMQTDARNVVQHRRDGQVKRRCNGSSETRRSEV